MFLSMLSGLRVIHKKNIGGKQRFGGLVSKSLDGGLGPPVCDFFQQ